MSGEYCESCGCGGYVRASDGAWSGFECDLCGYRINKLSGMRMWLSEEGMEHCARLAAKKCEGKLFFVRVKFSSKKSGDANIHDVMGVFGVGGASTGSDEAVMQVAARPSEEQLERARALPGVVSVRVV